MGNALVKVNRAKIDVTQRAEAVFFGLAGLKYLGGFNAFKLGVTFVIGQQIKYCLDWLVDDALYFDVEHVCYPIVISYIASNRI